MTASSPMLTLSPAWKQAHPNACMGILAMQGISQPQKSPALEEASRAVEAGLGQRFSDRQSIKGHPVIQAYATYYKRFKKTYHVAAQAESVALKGRKIPRFAPLVQAMFTAELKNLMLTAGHDLDQMLGGVRLDCSSGEEAYEAMGGRQQTLKPGDMYVADHEGILSAIIYGPAERAKISRNTVSALFTVYGVPGVAPEAIENHLRDMKGYVELFSPKALTGELAVYGI